MGINIIDNLIKELTSMKIRITGRKIDVTEGLKGYVERKMARLDKFFPQETEAVVTLSVQKDNQTSETTIRQNDIVFRAEVTTLDMYSSIDKSLDLLERQIRKQKTRLEKKIKNGDFSALIPADMPDIEEEKEFKIVKTKVYKDKPMGSEEAILQMNLLGHAFYIFTNSENMRTAVVYKRKDGDYGLIEME